MARVQAAGKKYIRLKKRRIKNYKKNITLEERSKGCKKFISLQKKSKHYKKYKTGAEKYRLKEFYISEGKK